VTDASQARPTGGWRRPGPWILAGVVLTALSLPGGLAAAHLVRLAPEIGFARPLTGSGTSVNFSMNLTDTPAFVPRNLNATVNGSAQISVALNNTGSLAHTFTLVNLSQAGVVLNRSWTPEQLDAYFAANGTLENVNVSGGTLAYANFTIPANSSFRSFEFVSTIPYQFQSGMWGFLNLTPAGPTLMLTENTTNSLQFVPNVLSAGPSVHGPVTLHVLVTNEGDLSHTFTVAAQSNTTLTTIAYFASHSPMANVSVPASAGGTIWANFTVPGVGVYEYACTVPGHFADGMYGFLYVGVPVPPPPPTPSTTIVAVPVLLGSLTILGIGGVFAVASALTGRFPKRPREPGHPA
jgi:uncharacterized cupredoxin-like copper-binding protein